MEKTFGITLQLEVKNCGYLEILEQLDSEFLDVSVTAKKGFETIEGDILDLTAEIFIVEVSLNGFCLLEELKDENNFKNYIINELKKIHKIEILSINQKIGTEDFKLEEDNFEIDFGKIKVVNNIDKLKNLDKKVIFVNERMAFGTGRHGTTKMCLESLIYIYEKYLLDKNIKIENALDVGCGSGILAIFFAKLFEKNVEAVDIDVDALEVAVDFSLINNVDKNVFVYKSSLFANVKDVKYDLIMANILLSPLIEMAEQVENKIAKNGFVILSGFLEEQSEILLKKYESKNFKLEKKLVENEWVCFIMQYLGK
jgi:ribosomal protein L11 methyltransferase